MRAKRLAVLVAVGAVAAGTVLVTASAAGGAPSVSRAAAANDNPAFVEIVDNNVENLPTVDLTCPGDWQDLVYYLKRLPLKPDLLTIQQISDQKQLNSYVARLSRDLGEQYTGVIAEATPSTILRGKCGAPKYYQTNAVIFRNARFTNRGLGHRTWQAQSDTTGSCVNNTQARTKAVKVRLHDKVAGKDLTVASVHWPTGKSGGPGCANSNAGELAAEMTEDGYGGKLLVAGGDFNFGDLNGDTFRSWYRSLNGDLGGTHGYRDPAYTACSGAKSCLRNNWTIGGDHRIDFLFARKPGGGLPRTTAFHTITFNEGDAADKAETGSDRDDRNYSDHRAVMAKIYY